MDIIISNLKCTDNDHNWFRNYEFLFVYLYIKYFIIFPAFMWCFVLGCCFRLSPCHWQSWSVYTYRTMAKQRKITSTTRISTEGNFLHLSTYSRTIIIFWILLRKCLFCKASWMLPVKNIYSWIHLIGHWFIGTAAYLNQNPRN